MKTRAHVISVCLSAGLLLSACGSLPGGATPTLPASPTSAPTVPPQLSTAIVMTATALARGTAAATSTPVATTTTAPATAAATSAAPTSQPTAGNPTVVPGQPRVQDAILILSPGSTSSVTSPAHVSGEADPTFEQNLVVQVTDGDGTVIITTATTIQSVGPVRGPFDLLVPFSVSAQGPGRLSVFSTSPRDGGLIHLSSVDVTLLSGGSAAITPGQAHNEAHIILEPAPQAHISGGMLRVSGYSDYVFESQLALALCGEGGSGAAEPVCGTADNVLAAGTASLNASDIGQPGPFAGTLTYHVSTTTSARLAVYSRSPRDGGLVHLSSVPVQLAP